MHTSNKPLVSIIIASHRSNYMQDLTGAFTQEVTGNVPYEIIVIADYSISNFRREYPQISWHYYDAKNISAKRNLGVRYARGAIIGFIDDDCIPMKGWLIEAAEYLKSHPDVGAVEGKTSISDSDEMHTAPKEYYRLERPGYRSNNMFYRRTLFLEVGGFDERFTLQREDLDLALSFTEKGYRIEYSSAIQVEHRIRCGEWWDFLKNCINRRFDPLLYKKHRRAYRKMIGSPFSPSLQVLLAAHSSVIITVGLGLKAMIWCIAIDTIILMAIAFRRVGISPKMLQQLGLEVCVQCIAPLLLLVALTYGNIKYRVLFII